MLSSNVFIGVDVSKQKLDIHCNPSGHSFQIKNDLEGISSFIEVVKKKYQDLNPDISIHIGLESTGRYHMLFFKTVSLSSSFKVSIVNPKKIFHFAKSHGDLAKTDKMDSKIIALYLEKIGAEASVYDKDQEKFKILVTRRKQIVVTIAFNQDIRTLATFKPLFSP